MLKRLFSNKTKVNLGFQILGIDQETETALSRFLRDAVTPFPTLKSAIGAEPNVRELAAGFLSGGPRGQSLGKLRSLLRVEDVQHIVLDKLETMFSTHPDGEKVVEVLSKVSHLPIEGWGDVEHSGPIDFIKNGVFPLITGDGEKAAFHHVACPCGVDFPITEVEHDYGLVQCPSCETFMQLREHI